MGMSLEATARAMRAAMRETVKRYSLWHLIFKGLLCPRRHLQICPSRCKRTAKPTRWLGRVDY